MANAAQLERLKRDIMVWNHWRAKHPRGRGGFVVARFVYC